MYHLPQEKIYQAHLPIAFISKQLCLNAKDRALAMTMFYINV